MTQASSAELNTIHLKLFVPVCLLNNEHYKVERELVEGGKLVLVHLGGRNANIGYFASTTPPTPYHSELRERGFQKYWYRAMSKEEFDIMMNRPNHEISPPDNGYGGITANYKYDIERYYNRYLTKKKKKKRTHLVRFTIHGINMHEKFFNKHQNWVAGKDGESFGLGNKASIRGDGGGQKRRQWFHEQQKDGAEWPQTTGIIDELFQFSMPCNLKESELEKWNELRQTKDYIWFNKVRDDKLKKESEKKKVVMVGQQVMFDAFKNNINFKDDYEKEESMPAFFWEPVVHYNYGPQQHFGIVYEDETLLLMGISTIVSILLICICFLLCCGAMVIIMFTLEKVRKLFNEKWFSNGML
eukprot:147868_1